MPDPDERDPADIAAEVVADPPLLGGLLDAARADDARAAEAAELAARERPELLAPYADTLIEIAGAAHDAAVRQSAAQMLARVELTEERAHKATEVLEPYLAEGTEAVKAWALSAIVALANEHPALRARARDLVRSRLDEDGPLRERARLLLDQADSWPSGAGAS